MRLRSKQGRRVTAHGVDEELLQRKMVAKTERALAGQPQNAVDADQEARRLANRESKARAKARKQHRR